MLRVTQLEELQALLLRIPELVDSLERRDAESIRHIKAWLIELEEALENNRLAVAGNIAALRARLIASEGGMAPDGYIAVSRITRRKLLQAVSSDVLTRASDLITEATQSDDARINEAKQLMRQLVTLANLKGLIPADLNGNEPKELLSTIWASISSDQDLQSGAVRIQGLVGPYDALILLDRAITADL